MSPRDVSARCLRAAAQPDQISTVLLNGCSHSSCSCRGTSSRNKVLPLAAVLLSTNSAEAAQKEALAISLARLCIKATNHAPAVQSYR
jgi:hypothetical protein